MSTPALSPTLALALRRVAEAAGTFRVPPGPGAPALSAALWDLEKLGLVRPAGSGERRGWCLTPAGEARWAYATGRGEGA